MPPDMSPDRHPRLHVWIARLGTAAIAGGAVAGSSVHLYVMADTAGMTAPWAPPLGLDAVALVAGVVRRLRPEDTLARRALAVTVLLSTCLQVMDSLMGAAGGPVGAVAVGAVMTAIPPLAGWLAFELFLRVTDGGAPADVEVDTGQDVPPAPAPPVEQVSPVVHAPSARMPAMTPTSSATPAPAPKPAPPARPAAPIPSADGQSDVLDAIRSLHSAGLAVTNKAVADRLGVTTRTISRRRKDPTVDAAFRDPGSVVGGVHALDRPGTLERTGACEEADRAPQAVSTPDLVGSGSSAGGVS